MPTPDGARAALSVHWGLWPQRTPGRAGASSAFGMAKNKGQGHPRCKSGALLSPWASTRETWTTTTDSFPATPSTPNEVTMMQQGARALMMSCMCAARVVFPTPGPPCWDTFPFVPGHRAQRAGFPGCLERPTSTKCPNIRQALPMIQQRPGAALGQGSSSP